MPVGKKFTSLTAGKLQPVNSAEIEEELSELWRSAAEDPETEHAVVRACVLTLVVYVESEQAGNEALQWISRVIAENPCRTIVMVAAENERPHGLSSWISAQCHLPAVGAKQVCCEQIYLHARGSAVQALDSIVIPLVIPGLPVFLWWKAGRFAPPDYLDSILRITNRVLIDSGTFEEPGFDHALLARQMERFKGSHDLAFSDLAWAQLTPCRELIAQCFDSAEAMPYLERLAEVRLEWDQSQSPNERRAQALMLSAWLASRLGWESAAPLSRSSGQSQTLRFRKGDRTIGVECVARAGAGDQPIPISITLKTADTPAAQFSITERREEGKAHTRAEIPGVPPRERTVRLRAADPVSLVNEELKFPGRDKIYEETLGLLARMFHP